MRVLKIDKTVFDIGFDSDWNKLMESYNTKGFDKMEFMRSLLLESFSTPPKEYNLFPTNLYVHNHFNMANSLIKNLPKILHVNGKLIMRNTNIEELPEMLFVGDILDIRRTKITKIPKNAIIRGKIYSDF